MSKWKKFKLKLANRLVKGDYFDNRPESYDVTNASNTPTGSTAEIAGIAARVGYRLGDISSTEFEDPEFDFSTISTAYDTDAYIRQGVDKYVDQIFKEGWTFYGKDENIVNYIKSRFKYMARVTNTPTLIFLQEITQDIVKYSNCIIVKSRLSDTNAFPPGQSITGLNGKDPVAGYFCLNVPSMKIKRDEYGTVKGWQQKIDGAPKDLEFAPEDIIHMYYKREQGNAFGTPLLQPVLDDVRLLRQIEEGVSKMMYRNIYPFYHAKVGTDEHEAQPNEIDEVKEQLEESDPEGGLVTSHRVEIKPIASDKVIDANPYLAYFENRVFSGLGIPPILFGRGGTANRSTGDNMTDEMSDRIKAMQTIIEAFINEYIITDLLLEGGYDPIVNPDQEVLFKFNQNDVDVKIKKENHAILMFQSNAINEDEMRSDIGRDPITERGKLYNSLYGTTDTISQTSNNETPTNQYGTKTSPKKNTNFINNQELYDKKLRYSTFIGFVDDFKETCITNINNCIYVSEIEKIKFYSNEVINFTNNCIYILENSKLNCNNYIYNNKVNLFLNSVLNTIKEYNSFKDKKHFITLLDTKINMLSDKIKNIEMESVA